VADSPYPLRVLPGVPIASRCQVVGPGRSVAIVGRPATFEILTKDAHGNACAGDGLAAALPLEAELTCGAATAFVAMQATRDGRFICGYELLTPGYWRLNVTSRGKPMPGTPYSVVASTAQVAALPVAVVPGASQGGEVAVEAAPKPPPLPSMPPRDESRIWAEIAAAQYADDGATDGWDDGTDTTGTANRKNNGRAPEDEYLESHPGVPVVENLEDIWQVSRLQRERKAREEREKEAKLKVCGLD
jgi:hypothetical protein